MFPALPIRRFPQQRPLLGFQLLPQPRLGCWWVGGTVGAQVFPHNRSARKRSSQLNETRPREHRRRAGENGGRRRRGLQCSDIDRMSVQHRSSVRPRPFNRGIQQGDPNASSSLRPPHYETRDPPSLRIVVKQTAHRAVARHSGQQGTRLYPRPADRFVLEISDEPDRRRKGLHFRTQGCTVVRREVRPEPLTPATVVPPSPAGEDVFHIRPGRDRQCVHPERHAAKHSRGKWKPRPKAAQAVNPPSTVIDVPVRYRPSGPAR